RIPHPASRIPSHLSHTIEATDGREWFAHHHGSSTGSGRNICEHHPEAGVERIALFDHVSLVGLRVELQTEVAPDHLCRVNAWARHVVLEEQARGTGGM